MTVGLVPSSAAVTADTGDQAVFRRHPGFTADSIGYNAETGQLATLAISY